jgi:hypothetical protein
MCGRDQAGHSFEQFRRAQDGTHRQIDAADSAFTGRARDPDLKLGTPEDQNRFGFFLAFDHDLNARRPRLLSARLWLHGDLSEFLEVGDRARQCRGRKSLLRLRLILRCDRGAQKYETRRRSHEGGAPISSRSL